MGQNSQLLILGIGGCVLGVDPATGTNVWKTKLKGGDLVTVSVRGGRVFAGAAGELFCLDAADGQVLWHNNLKGMGMGVVSFGSTGEGEVIAAFDAKRKAAAAAAAT